MKKVKVELPAPRIIDTDNDNERGEAPNDYELDDAVHTMQRAEDLKRNPKMMKHVSNHLQKKMKSLKSLKRLAFRKALDEQAESAE